jgi:hypothetical protein
VVPAFMEREADVVHYCERAETKGVCGFGAGARDVIPGKDVAERGRDGISVD